MQGGFSTALGVGAALPWPRGSLRGLLQLWKLLSTLVSAPPPQECWALEALPLAIAQRDLSPCTAGTSRELRGSPGFGGQGECYEARIWPYTRLSCNFKTALGDRSHKPYNSPSSSVGSGDF